MSKAIEITRYNRPDLRAESAAMEVMRSAFDPAFGEAWTASQLAGFMSMPGVILSLAVLDGAVLGFSLARHVADEAELLLLATHRNWQKRGVGNQLMTQFIADARKSRVSTLHLEARDGNSARNLYSRHGFEVVHRRTAYYRGHDGTMYDALSFRMELR